MAMMKQAVALPGVVAADFLFTCGPPLWQFACTVARILFPGEHDTAMIACFTAEDKSLCYPAIHYLDDNYE